MARVVFEITMSLDGFVAGPNQTLEEPLGEGGEQLHDWIVGLETWRQQHGLEGGETNADAELVRETNDRTGAFVMGRRMFSSGSGPWEDDPKANGCWGDDPPFDGPVFVVTHHAREPLILGTTTYTFVDGVDQAIRQAREAAGDRDVLLLIAWEGLTYDEVTEALGIPVGTVRSRLNRARRKARAALSTTHAKEPVNHG